MFQPSSLLTPYSFNDQINPDALSKVPVENFLFNCRLFTLLLLHNFFHFKQLSSEVIECLYPTIKSIIPW